MPASVFAIMRNNFFSLLASVNRQHHAALLVLYYRLFQEYTSGLEREGITPSSQKNFITGEDSYILFVFALLYGDSQNDFDYNKKTNAIPELAGLLQRIEETELGIEKEIIDYRFSYP